MEPLTGIKPASGTLQVCCSNQRELQGHVLVYHSLGAGIRTRSLQLRRLLLCPVEPHRVRKGPCGHLTPYLAGSYGPYPLLLLTITRER